MEERLNMTLGFYLPTFFKMQVNTDESFSDLKKLDDIPLAIYFHEYIHYLQDISTVFGLMNACAVVDYMKFSNNYAHKLDSNDFEVPVPIIDKDEFNIGFNRKLKTIYLGDSKNIAFNAGDQNPILKIYLEEIDVQNYSNTIQNIKQVYFETSYGKYCFGATCIMESMAYIGENALFPNLIPSPDLPYKSAEYVASHLYPAFSINKFNTFALCDISLFVFHPSKYFYDTLIEMKRQSWLPANPKDVYDFCLKNTEIEYENSHNLNSLFEQTNHKAKKQLSDYFTADIFRDSKEWIEIILNSAKEMRNKNIYFILDIVSEGKLNSEIFLSVFRTLGSPLVTNNLDEASFYISENANHLENIRIDLFWALSQVHRIFIGQQRDCKLKLFCRESCHNDKIPDITDNRCSDAPWERATDSELCAFAQIWKMWGLQHKKPK